MDPFIEHLKIELADRQLSNPKYSLRAFARDLGVNLTSLSTILADKRRPSKVLRKAISEKLALSPTQAMAADHQLDTAKMMAQDDSFHFVSEWHHLAILNLIREGLPPKTSQNIARRLALQMTVIETALARLIRLGYVERKGNHFVRVVRSIKTTEDIPSSAVRKLHSSVLKKAEDALQSVPVSEREFSTAFLMLKAASLPHAKDLVRNMRTQFIEACDPNSKAKKDSLLFALSIQLFPLEVK